MSLKTIREVAEQQSVSKQTIRKKMDDGFRRDYVSKEGNKLLISEAGVAELVKRLSGVEDGTENRNSQTQTANATCKPQSQTANQAEKVVTQQVGGKRSGWFARLFGGK
ncbi:hypothetical protein [Levilactobacillus fujinensis]|uniref:DUF536 domain-containing protein n=1 Tax=Levilactobacillus fujinensis TaxID=2486024 RepID=A0ABW1TD33_9LACO|nr:hypothetical protein [Levilactobacillus fujinensis]